MISRMFSWTIMIMESRRRKSSCTRTSMPLLLSLSGSAHRASQSTMAAVNLTEAQPFAVSAAVRCRVQIGGAT